MKVVVLAVEAAGVTTTGEHVSPQIEAAVPRVIADIEAQLAAWRVLETEHV